MASAARGSGTGGGDRCASGEKGTTPVGRRCKKPSAFHRAVLRYLEKEYRECMARGKEPLFDLEDLCVTVRHHQTRRFQLRHLLLRQQEIRQSILRSHARTVKTYVLLYEFLSCMLSTPLLNSVMD